MKRINNSLLLDQRFEDVDAISETVVGWTVDLTQLEHPGVSLSWVQVDHDHRVANWPAARRNHWRQLLVARAIENLACVVGVNRIGSDARGMDYSGDSLAISASMRCTSGVASR